MSTKSNIQSGNILVFGAHPDDMEIGMGGTITKLSKNGYNVKLVVATLPNFTDRDKKEERRIEAVNSSKVMGCKEPDFLDLSTEEMTHSRKLIGIIDKYIKDYVPQAIFTQWIGDSHQDHQALTKSVISGSRDTPDLYMYETTIPGGITEQSFRPQLFVDVTDYIETKKSALKSFESQQLRCGPIWIDAIVGRAAYRGYQLNCKYAESFEIIRISKY